MFMLVQGALYASTIALLAVQFTYRYVTVFKAQKLYYFQGFYFFFWILYVIWFAFEWAMGLYYFASLDDYSIEYMRAEMKDFYKLNIDQTTNFIVVVYESIPQSTNAKVRWWNLCCTFNMTFVMCFQYSIMIYCGRQLYYDMNEKISNLSKQLRKLHRQIFKTLVLQITTPTIVLFSPLVFTLYAPLFDLRLSVPTGVFLSGFSLYPALDAFVLMYVITDYRKAFQIIFTTDRLLLV
uniref:Seven TM Receptor n=2 Tax=Caenorhabditis japonica TaxID=281687 RepID=A0A8R1E4C2_CAEJA